MHNINLFRDSGKTKGSFENTYIEILCYFETSAVEIHLIPELKMYTKESYFYDSNIEHGYVTKLNLRSLAVDNLAASRTFNLEILLILY